MIDILFGESDAACMKYAKTICALPAEEGEPDTVICLAFMLDIGDIQEAMDSSYRQELIFSMYSQDQDGHDEAACRELKKAGASYIRQLARLEEYLRQGRAVRIWYSHSPYSPLWSLLPLRLDEVLQKSRLRSRASKMQGKRQPHCILPELGRGLHDEFRHFLPLERPLSSSEREMYALLWKNCEGENAPSSRCHQREPAQRP